LQLLCGNFFVINLREQPLVASPPAGIPPLLHVVLGAARVPDSVKEMRLAVLIEAGVAVDQLNSRGLVCLFFVGFFQVPPPGLLKF
jgi:hypothetical protein